MAWGERMRAQSWRWAEREWRVGLLGSVELLVLVYEGAGARRLWFGEGGKGLGPTARAPVVGWPARGLRGAGS